MIFPQGNITGEYAREAAVQGHSPSTMTAGQIQDYIDLVIAKADQFGEHYVARQVAWGVAELDRLEGRV
jgi:hypothetical protein